MKLCEICKKNEATVTLTEINKDGQKTDLFLCPTCAREKGFVDIPEIGKTLSEIINELKEKIQEEDTRLACPECRITFADFKRRGRLGCATCYTAFSPKIKPLLKRLHGSSQHLGKKITSGTKPTLIKYEIKRLRTELKWAIQEEDYEKAARLRDLLRKANENETDR